jgi:hypothetical protein
MLKRPDGHFKYLALAQALSEMGYQYDVLYGGDGAYGSDALDINQLCRYKAILVPEAGYLTPAQAETLSCYVNEHGGQLIQFAQNPAEHPFSLGAVHDEALLYRFWKEYQAVDREEIAAFIKPDVSQPVRTSHTLVNAIRYARDSETILHLLNYQYDEAQDLVKPVENLVVTLPWEDPQIPQLRWISLSGEQSYPCKVEDGTLTFEIPMLDLYGLAILS